MLPARHGASSSVLLSGGAAPGQLLRFRKPFTGKKTRITCVPMGLSVIAQGPWDRNIGRQDAPVFPTSPNTEFGSSYVWFARKDVENPRGCGPTSCNVEVDCRWRHRVAYMGETLNSGPARVEECPFSGKLAGTHSGWYKGVGVHNSADAIMKSSKKLGLRLSFSVVSFRSVSVA